MLVDDGTDALCSVVDEGLHRRGHETCRVPAGSLSLQSLHIDGAHAYLAGSPIRGALFRTAPQAAFGDGFPQGDQGFAAAEARSAWLAVLNLDSVVCLNRGDPEIWFGHAEWAIWRRRFATADVPLSELAVGDVDDDRLCAWLPWGGGVATAPGPAARRFFGPALTPANELVSVLWCRDEILQGPDSAAVRAGAAVLRHWGVQFAEFVVDSMDRIATVTAHPPVVNDEVAARVGKRVVELFDAALSRG